MLVDVVGRVGGRRVIGAGSRTLVEEERSFGRRSWVVDSGAPS